VGNGDRREQHEQGGLEDLSVAHHQQVLLDRFVPPILDFASQNRNFCANSSPGSWSLIRARCADQAAIEIDQTVNGKE
jgi:hypothetical protein